MSFDTRAFADKLKRCQEHVGIDTRELARRSGFAAARIDELTRGDVEPSGDEILILADIFKIDFKFFISNDAKTPFEQMEVLYRKYGSKVGAADRRAIAELLYLCDTEQFLQEDMGRRPTSTFSFTKSGTYFKGHGERCAAALRDFLGLDTAVRFGDAFAVARRLGVHVFRRPLDNSAISGLTVRHPAAGPCILVNRDEDPYRQRFTLAHELGHVFLDEDEAVVVSFGAWRTEDLREVRADTFAANLLVPRDALTPLRGRDVSEQMFVELAHRLEVNAPTLARAMTEANVITRDVSERFRALRLPRASKEDPELGGGLTERQRERKARMLDRGLSQSYVELCFDAYSAEKVSRGRVAEALLIGEDELDEVARLYGRVFAHA
ncbi:MAG: XRE family transcriptional regulator [Sandaracinus sp.]